MWCLGRILNVSCHEHHVNYFCVVLERIIYVVYMTARQPFENDTPGYGKWRIRLNRPVHPPYSSVFVTEFNPEYGNTDLLIWLRKRSSPKYGNAHHLNIFFTVISSCACVKNVAPSVGNVHVPLYYARCQATRNIP